MWRSIAAAFVWTGICLMLACEPDRLTRHDEGWREACVVYVSVNEPAEITRDMFERCESLQVWVVRFGDGS